MDLSKTQRTTKQTGVLRPAVAAQVVRKEEMPVTNTPINATVSPKEAHRQAWQQLEVVLSAALDIAYSDSLPEDAPGMATPRTVEARRRHWMYLAAVSFSTHNPVLAADEEAVPEAVALAHDLMLDRDAAARTSQEKDARIRRMNGLPPTADAHRATPAEAKAVRAAFRAEDKAMGAPLLTPVVDERTEVVPGYSAGLEAGVLKAMDTLKTVGRNFENEDIQRNPKLKIAAAQYARQHPAPKSEWLGKVQAQMDVRAQFAAASLTDGQARGILNVWKSRHQVGK